VWILYFITMKVNTRNCLKSYPGSLKKVMNITGQPEEVYEYYRAAWRSLWILPSSLKKFMNITGQPEEGYEYYRAAWRSLWILPSSLKKFMNITGQPEEGYEYYRMTPETHSQYTIIKIKNAAHVFTDFFFHRQEHITKMPVTHRNERMRRCIQNVENYVNTQCCTCIRRLCFCLEKCLYGLLLFDGIYRFFLNVNLQISQGVHRG